MGEIFDKLRIQGRMLFFEKRKQSTLNHVLIADSESTQKNVQNHTGFIDDRACCVELWPKQVLHRISVPMSYISLW